MAWLPQNLSPKRFWYGSSFQTRLMVLLALLVYLTAGAIIAIAATNYRKDKIAYIYELNHARGKSLMVRGRASLLDSAGVEPLEIPSRAQKQLDDWKLPRWPESGEVFVGELDGKPTLVGRDDEGEFWKKPFSTVSPPWDATDDTSYWITSYGLFLGTNRPRAVSEASIKKRAAVIDFLRSTLVQGLVTVEQGGESVIAAYREIPGTNVNVFVETSVTKALAPLRQFLVISVIASLVFVSLAVAVGMVLLRGLTRPLKEVQRITTTVARGTYSFRVQHPYDDELHQVFQHLGHMAYNLRVREEGLVRLKNSIEHLLVGTRNMTAATERAQVAALAAQSAAGDIRVAQSCNGWIYLLRKEKLEEGERTFLLGGQVLVEGEASEETALVECECSDVKDPEEVFAQGGPALAPRLGKVFVPIVHNDEKLGFLVLDGYREKTLHPEDQAFLATLSASLAISLQNINYLEDVREKTRIDTELGAARSVQESLLPEVRAFEGIEVSAYYAPAEAAGGDWYGYTYSEEEKLFFFYLGDVTGHGIPAALMTGVAFGAVRAGELACRRIAQLSELSVQERLAAVAQQANDIVAESGKGRLVMTMAFLALDIRTGTCHLLNAGQTSPFHIKALERKAKPLVGGGSILGTRRPGEFLVSSFQLEPGDSVFLYTDGLIENSGPTGAILKKKKLQELLQADSSVEEVMTGVLTEARSIWRNHPPKDDVSSLLVRWKPPQDATKRIVA